MNKLKKYLIRKWESLVKDMYPDNFVVNDITVVKVKKGKIREWRAFKDGKRMSKEALNYYLKNYEL